MRQNWQIWLDDRKCRVTAESSIRRTVDVKSWRNMWMSQSGEHFWFLLLNFELFYKQKHSRATFSNRSIESSWVARVHYTLAASNRCGYSQDIKKRPFKSFALLSRCFFFGVCHSLRILRLGFVGDWQMSWKFLIVINEYCIFLLSFSY